MQSDKSRTLFWDRLLGHLKGHAFQFDAVVPPAYPTRAGWKLLLVFAFLEFILGPRLTLFRQLGLPSPSDWFRIPLLMAVALFLKRLVVRLRLPQIGLSAWRDWRRSELSYFVQVLLIANLSPLADKFH